MHLTTRRLRAPLIPLLLTLSLVAVPGCSDAAATASTPVAQPSATATAPALTPEAAAEASASESPASAPAAEATTPSPTTSSFDLARLPAYTGSPYTVVNGNVPTFTDADLTGPEEAYSPLDTLGRCGVAQVIVSPATMPTEERTSIGMIRPSGWHTVRYDDLIADRYLYNRCHLIGFQLAGENANERNLITGTRYLNVEGMLPFENEVADYVHATGNRVLYRATPVFAGNELVARGVHLEAQSVEDGGTGVSFNVFCYNVQPGIGIDYATGESWRVADGVADAGERAGNAADDAAAGFADGASTADSTAAPQMTYILNTNTGKFHLPGCRSVNQMTDRNKQEFVGTREEAIARGYSPCGNCNP